MAIFDQIRQLVLKIYHSISKKIHFLSRIKKKDLYVNFQLEKKKCQPKLEIPLIILKVSVILPLVLLSCKISKVGDRSGG